MRKMSSAPPLPAAGEGKRGEEGHLGYLLRQASSSFRLRVERALADIGVTHPQFVVLTMLASYPGLSNADLARIALLTPQTVSVIVSNLLRVRALSRHPHSVHGRIQNIQLTEKGAKILAKCRLRVRALEREIAEIATADEERVIRRWLVKVARPGEPE
jgi:DNA-binding MarR family transcriptional regulator